MKSRRLILTIEVQTDLTIAEIRNADRIAIGTDSHMGAVWIYREPGPGAGLLVQVQANAIRPEPRSVRDFDKMTKKVVKAEQSVQDLQPVRKSYTLPKAKRAKGAK